MYGEDLAFICEARYFILAASNAMFTTLRDVYRVACVCLEAPHFHRYCYIPFIAKTH